MSDMDTEFDGLELLTPKLKQHYKSIKKRSNLRRDRSHTLMRTSASVDTTVGTSTHSIGLGHPCEQPTIGDPLNASQVDIFTTDFNLALLRTPRADNEYTTAAELCLKVHNTIDFAHFTNPLRLFAIQKGVYASAWASEGTPIYALVRNNKVATLMLRLKVETGSNKTRVVPQLQVHLGDGWSDFGDLIDSLPLLKPQSYDGEEGHELQYQWWRQNGKHFRLLDMPADLLPTMLLQLMGRAVYCGYTFEYPRRTFQDLFYLRGVASSTSYLYDQNAARNHDPFYSLLREVVFAPVNDNVLLLNKAILPIAKDVLMKDTVKVFFCRTYQAHNFLASTIHRFIRYTPTCNTLANLRHLKLCYENRVYCTFFGVQHAPPVVATYTRNEAYLLRKLPNLRSLELHFLPCMAPNSDPWTDEEEEESDWPFDHYLTGRYPCQKVIVEWILAYAYQYISEVPEVLLTGFIKTTTKAKWSKLLSNSRRDESAKAVQQELDEIEAIHPADLPPRCFCPSRCAFVDLDRLSQWFSDEWKAGRSQYDEAAYQQFALADWKFDYNDEIDDGRYANGPISESQDKEYFAKLPLHYPKEFGRMFGPV